jgi:hypothetical protein
VVTSTPEATQLATEVAGAVGFQTSPESATATNTVSTDEPTETSNGGPVQDITLVRPNPDAPPAQGEVVDSYDVGELWPPNREGVSEYEDGGSPRMLLEAPDVSVTRTTLGANYSDGSAYLEASLLSNPPFYAEQCLLARLNAVATSGYVLCLASTAETFAYYFDDELEPGLRVELLAPEVRLGTNSPGDWNVLEIRAVDDHLWFLINDMLIGAAIHDGRKFGEVGVTAFREGDQTFDIGWGVLATLELEQ